MCGIAGFNWQDDVLGRRMAELIRHRGPDASGFYSNGERVSLVHTRLSIIDLHEPSNQPLHYEHGGRKYVLVFNGEIYNYRELRLELERLGCQFQTQADSEVILAAFAVWGAESVRRFNGMWAFAIFDEHENTLFLSRDRFGKKPLYYYNTNGRFIFASEIKVILGCPQVSRVADSERVSDLLNFELAGHTDGTFFRDVKQLPAGTNAVLDLATGQWNLERYYTLPRSLNSASPSDVHETLRVATTRRLVSDVPICLSLSGGVDSSAIAAMIAEDHDSRMI